MFEPKFCNIFYRVGIGPICDHENKIQAIRVFMEGFEDLEEQ